jgi:peptidoglycan/LPS O-acetylase OafA/YrhL
MGHSRAFYPELESLRGLAAFVVLMQHIFSNLHPTRETLLTPTFNGIANLVITSVFGGTGAVTLFFVLSGFVLAESLAEKQTIDLRVYGSFLVKRFFRLMPAAWASIGLAIALMVVYHHAPVPWEKLPAALLLDRDATPAFNGPLWSVNVEAIGSALFPLLLVASRAGGFIGRLVLLAALIWAYRYVYIADLYALTYLFCFQLGIMARELTGPIIRRSGPTLSLALLALATLLVTTPTNASRLGYITEITHVRLEALGALYVIGYVISERGQRFGLFLKRRPLIFLGRISYSVYALHYPIIGMLMAVGWSFVAPDRYLLAQSFCALLIVPAVLVAATLGFYLIERPCRNFGRGLATRLNRQRSVQEPVPITT